MAKRKHATESDVSSEHSLEADGAPSELSEDIHGVSSAHGSVSAPMSDDIFSWSIRGLRCLRDTDTGIPL